MDLKKAWQYLRDIMNSGLDWGYYEDIEDAINTVNEYLKNDSERRKTLDEACKDLQDILGQLDFYKEIYTDFLTLLYLTGQWSYFTKRCGETIKYLNQGIEYTEPDQIHRFASATAFGVNVNARFVELIGEMVIKKHKDNPLVSQVVKDGCSKNRKKPYWWETD
jgi:hypothetical protein